jgi:23S rRNA (pseudouridine1915-N3)-methyltransferase
VGKTKEQFIRDGIAKYIKMLQPFTDITFKEIKEEKGKDIRRMIEKEGEKVINLNIPYILLDERGKSLSSVEFAQFLHQSRPAVNFVIGGAYGVSERVKKMARKRVALSKMTFTHEMSRLFLLEQVYRACTIIQGRGYHH